jgi:hypothetical protein
MSKEKTSRTVLPTPDRAYVGLTTDDAKDPDTKYPPIEQLRPPRGAPNILIVLLDDVGFGTTSAFGGPCHVRRRCVGAVRHQQGLEPGERSIKRIRKSCTIFNGYG